MFLNFTMSLSVLGDIPQIMYVDIELFTFLHVSILSFMWYTDVLHPNKHVFLPKKAFFPIATIRLYVKDEVKVLSLYYDTTGRRRNIQ